MQNYSTPNYLHEIGNQPAMSSGSNNKFVYFKQNFVPNVQNSSSKVLVNPHFNKKVFVNPNYIPSNPATFSGNIHVNPNIAFSLPRENSKIHINPKILQKVPSSQDYKNVPIESNSVEPKQNVIMYSSKTKLIRKPVKEQTIQESKRIRRTSIYTKLKVVKSCTLNKSPENNTKNRLVFNSKYKLKRESSNKLVKSSSPVKLRTRFKLDNRSKTLLSISHKNAKYVFINRFLSISDIAKTVPLRTNRSLLNISGMVYKNSPNRLQKVIKIEKRKLLLSNQKKPLSKTRFKIVRVPEAKSSRTDKKKFLKNSRFSTKKLKVSQEKLKKCNIPCLYYRKFGKCKGKDLGRCPRKHDPDQIALCTKFLQGACIDTKCSLSHNVSAEKMPTCKFYLEGSCSKDSCPYLHVRISPKADICKDFLEGFCKKASECDKRHQFLCPDFEKKGACLKTRCSYPHGRMVRKYSDYNKHKFAKKSSKSIKDDITNKIEKNLVGCSKIEEKIEPEVNPAIRYYSDKKIEAQNSIKIESNDEVDSNQKINLRIRPKLGDLPSFILLEDQ